MRNKIIALVCTFLLAISISSCGGRPNPSSSVNPHISSNTTTQALDPQDDIRDTVKEILAQTYSEDKIQTVSAQEGKVEADIIYVDAIPDVAPDDWEDVKADAVQTCMAIQDAVSEDDINFVVVYLLDADENILLTTMNGDVSYNVFEEQPNISAPNNPTISLEEFNKIQTGMSYQEVCNIIGGSGELLSESDLGLGDEYRTTMYAWEGEGLIGANADVMFQGGKVISKAQFGLE